MRLSDVKGDRCLDVVADIIDPVCNIAESESFKKLMKRVKLTQNDDKRVKMTIVARGFTPVILECKNDVIAILATIEGVTPEEYADGLTLAKLMKDAFDLITDEEFLSFLPSAETATE